MASERNRSVNDFDTSKGLKEALKSQNYRGAFSDVGRYFNFPRSLVGSSCNYYQQQQQQQQDDDDAQSEASTTSAIPPGAELDWVLYNYNAQQSQTQSLSEELKRLQVLRSYLLLDSERESSFERLTALASRMFRVPIALVSLVDLGRQWFMSNRGLGNVRETPRRNGFCAYGISSPLDLFIVPDTTQDARFADNPVVTGPPHIRFYAGAPLVCPEGYKLGMFCIIDSTPRPDGLSLDEKQNLVELAALAVDAMVERKRRCLETRQSQSQLIACTAHDLLTPLSGVQMSLSLLQEDCDFQDKLNPQQKEMLETVSSCASVMNRICSQAIDTFRQGTSSPGGGEGRVDGTNAAATTTTTTTTGSSSSDWNNGGDAAAATTSVVRRHDMMMDTHHHDHFDNEKKGRIVISSLVKNLHMVMDPYPKKVPLYITVDPMVPSIIVADDLKLFRSAINLLTNACKHTTKGSVHLKLYLADDNNNSSNTAIVAPFTTKTKLVFECHDTGPGIPIELYPFLFQPCVELSSSNSNNNRGGGGDCTMNDHVSCSDVMDNSGLGLYSIATHISSIGGEYGFRPRNEENEEQDHQHDHGAIFWFSIPLRIPDDSNDDYNNNNDDDNVKHVSYRNHDDEVALTEQIQNLRADLKTSPEHQPSAERVPPIMAAAPFMSVDVKPAVNDAKKSGHSTHRGRRTRRALVIDDSVVVRKLLSQAFTTLGFEVKSASNGLEGLKELQANIYDLTLCDFLMPAMDGLDCVKQYRDWEAIHRPWFRQYIVGMSAHASDNDVAKGLAAGMNQYLSKPLTIKVLKEVQQNPELKRLYEELDALLDPGKWKAGERDESEDGKLRAEKRVKMDESSVTPPSRSGPICLVGEDTSSVIKSMTMTMESKLWNPVFVKDGEDALRLLKMRRWDAVFLDDEMPLLNGIRVLERFRQWENEHRVARQKNVFLISESIVPTLTPGNSVSASYPTGFDGALGKPILPQNLIQLLKTAALSISTISDSMDIVAR